MFKKKDKEKKKNVTWGSVDIDQTTELVAPDKSEVEQALQQIQDNTPEYVKACCWTGYVFKADK